VDETEGHEVLLAEGVGASGETLVVLVDETEGQELLLAVLVVD